MTRNLENDGGDLVEAVDVSDEKSDEVDRLDDLLGALQPNTTIVIERLQPSWCAGFLEEVTLSEQIGIEYFKETWGGHLLSVKVRGKRGRFTSGSYKVPLFSYPPLRYGEPLKPYNKNERFKEEETPQISGVSGPVVVTPSNPLEKLFAALPSVLPLVIQYMKNQDEKRQQEMQMMIQMVRGNSNSGLSDIAKVGTVMGQLQQMFKDQSNAGAGAGGGEMDFLPHALDVLKMVMSPNAGAASGAPASGAPAVIPPVPASPQLRSPNKTIPPPGQSRPPQNVTPLKNNPDNEQDISDIIAGLSPDEAVDTVFDALDRMPQDKREATIAIFGQVYQEDMADEIAKFLGGKEEDKNRGAQ